MFVLREGVKIWNENVGSGGKMVVGDEWCGICFFCFEWGVRD